jgi:hypothetical protein
MEPSPEEKNAEDNFFQVINFEQHTEFYNRILIEEKSDYYRRIRQIMTTADNFRDIFIDNGTNDFASAAADFAREMTSNEPSGNNYIDFKNFCAYFEFAFTEFVRNHADLEESHEDCGLFLQTQFFNGPLINPDNHAISNEAFQNLLTAFNNYKKDVTQAELHLTNLFAALVQEAEEFDEVRAMARNYKLTFGSKPSAVYHWRKHRNINIFNPLSAFDYFREANEVVAEGYLEKNSVFVFKKTVDKKRYRFVMVRNYRPFCLITFHVKEY